MGSKVPPKIASFKECTGCSGAACQAARDPEGTPATGAPGGLPGYPLGPPQDSILPHIKTSIFPPSQYYVLSIVTELILTSLRGRSWAPRGTLEIFSTTS